MTRLRSNLQMGPVLGAGHFGEVCLANDDVHGKVAVKVMRQRPGETPADWDLRKRSLVAEGQRLSQAKHDNVVQVFHVLESDTSDAVHLVMEYCANGSLQRAFDNGPLPLAAVRKLTTEVALGLQALHARGMLHRDIKPGNLLLDRQGRARLGDFGLVTDNIIFGYAEQAGYLDHLAPEVWNGSGTSIRSDIWALGMTVFRLLHGAEWYTRAPAPRRVIADGGFANTLRWLPHIPQGWRRFVRKMLSDDPHVRYQNATQVINALAMLPTEPRWGCSVMGAEVRCEMETKARRVIVTWKTHGPRSYTWEAWSEPLGTGRRRILGGATKIGRTESEKQLVDFFSRYS